MSLSKCKWLGLLTLFVAAAGHRRRPRGRLTASPDRADSASGPPILSPRAEPVPMNNAIACQAAADAFVRDGADCLLRPPSERTYLPR
jgi:hypothetical protein